MKRKVLVVDDEQNMQTLMRMILEERGHEVIVACSAEAALTHLDDARLDVVLSDLRMPGMGGEAFIAHCRRQRPDVPVVVITAHGTIKSAVASIHQGAADYLTKPFEPEALEIAVHNALKLRDILRENEQLKAAVTQNQARRKLVGHSAAAQKLADEIQRVAPFKSNVLIGGESGTGKELVARTIHESGPLHARPWVAINCSAIPRDLMESELFGYIKGAFSGATQNRIGRIEQANGSTLFLDEIGDLDIQLQAKLLRVLQEREYSPLGSNQVRSANVRVIAASNRDLKQLVAEGRFREDLYYRLDVYRIVVPPLRARRDDVPLLAQTFLRELSLEMNKPARGFTAAAEQALLSYDWPGNVRELRNTIERALLMCRNDHIDVADLPQTVSAGANSTSARDSIVAQIQEQDLDAWLDGVQRRAIIEALAQCGGVQAHAAKKLGISERSLWHRIKKLNIRVNKSFA